MRVSFAAALFIASSLFAADRPLATIVSYHLVEPDGTPSYKLTPRQGAPDVQSEEVRYTVSLDNFKAQLEYLEQNDYHVIPLSDLVDYMKGRRESLPQKSVVITVDDGWLSAYTEIFPMLQQRHMPFTLFIYPQIVGKGKGYLTWPQITEMAGQGVDIEDHTFTHPFLTLRRNHEVKPEDYDRFLEHELLDSKREIEKHVGRPVRFISYPYSNFDRVVQSAVEQYGYEAAVYDRDKGALIDRDTSPMNLIRFPVVHDTTLEQFESFLVR